MTLHGPRYMHLRARTGPTASTTPSVRPAAKSNLHRVLTIDFKTTKVLTLVSSKSRPNLTRCANLADVVLARRPMAFLTELATNATERGVHVIIYSGNDDSLVSHMGSEGELYNHTIVDCAQTLTILSRDTGEHPRVQPFGQSFDHPIPLEHDLWRHPRLHASPCNSLVRRRRRVRR